MSDTVNAVLSDTEHIYFTNNAILAGEGTDILVKTSALGGYRQYGVTQTKKRFILLHWEHQYLLFVG